MAHTKIPMEHDKKIALVAHDHKKRDLVEWAKYNRVLLAHHEVFATGTTGKILEKGLVPSQFSQRWMAIQPAEARIARVLPFVMPADNIGPVGVSEWLDPATGAKLMLLYLDRPSRVIGAIVYEGRQLKFDIEAKEAGYLWVRQPEGNGTFRAVPKPDNVQLAVFPLGRS